MKFGVVNKSTTVNRFTLQTLQRNITHLAVITGKTNIKLGVLKGGNRKRAQKISFNFIKRKAIKIFLKKLKKNFEKKREMEKSQKLYCGGDGMFWC